MTPINLMDALAARLQKLLTDYTAEQPSGTVPVTVFPGYVPVQNNAAEKNSFVYVLVVETDDREGNDKSTAVVELGFSIYDADGTDGWRSLFNVAEHVRQDLLKHRFIDMRFRLDLSKSIQFKVQENQPYPQWEATMTVTYTIGQPEEEGFNYDDFQEVQAYGKYEEYKNH